MSGYVAMHRGWHDHDIFEGEEYSRRDAWSWLIANAAWKPTKVRIKGSSVQLARGDMCFALRFLAVKWGWSKSKVDRFLAVLRAEGMIETHSKSGTTAGQGLGQGQTIISICNYEQFQSKPVKPGDNDDAESGTTAGQQRDKEEPSKPDNQEPKEEVGGGKPPTSFAFFGRTIRLKPSDLERWQRTYHTIGDMNAELMALDAWWQEQPEDRRKKWFHPTVGMLNRKHQENLAARRDYDRDRITV